MRDLLQEIDAIRREVVRRSADDAETVSVVLRRDYDAAIEDVWEVITDPDRIRRWFLPLSGDLRPGGTFQLEGNAGGDILTCEAPTLLRVTFGGPTSIVEVRLSAVDSRTLLELNHTVPIEIARSGAGALFVGPGWDGAVLALGLYLDGEVIDDPVAAANSPEGQAFSRDSVHAWTAVVAASGTATEEELAGATTMALSHFAPDVS